MVLTIPKGQEHHFVRIRSTAFGIFKSGVSNKGHLNETLNTLEIPLFETFKTVPN